MTYVECPELQFNLFREFLEGTETTVMTRPDQSPFAKEVREIRVACADGAYDTRRCHDELMRKKIKALIPPRTRAGYWSPEYADRNQAVARQWLNSSQPSGVLSQVREN